MLCSPHLIPTHIIPLLLISVQTIQLPPCPRSPQTPIPLPSPHCRGRERESPTAPLPLPLPFQVSHQKRTHSIPTIHPFTQSTPPHKEATLHLQTINRSSSKVTLNPMGRITRPLLQLWLSMDLSRPVCRDTKVFLVYLTPRGVGRRLNGKKRVWRVRWRKCWRNMMSRLSRRRLMLPLGDRFGF